MLTGETAQLLQLLAIIEQTEACTAEYLDLEDCPADQLARRIVVLLELMHGTTEVGLEAMRQPGGQPKCP
jgi:hypothetical protein